MRDDLVKPLLLVSFLTVAAVAGPVTPAQSESCSNSCVTMAIPRSPGVHTRLDGTADAVLWPPSHELRPIRISALNDRDVACDVTIEDVRQDEAPVVTGGGVPIDDAVNCSNEGDASTVELRSDRAESGNGRLYAVSFRLDDPDCSGAAKDDEVLVAVPLDENTTSLKPDADAGRLTSSYSGAALACVPQPEPDRYATYR